MAYFQFAFILTRVFIFQQLATVIAADLSLSVNLSSLYPGEDTSFSCSVNTSDSTVFHWTRFFMNGTNDTVILPEDADTAGSASSTTHYSTFSLTNVNYTDNGIGVQCNSSGSTSAITYITVLTPVISTILPVSPIKLQVGDTINITCRGLGGPRLVLSWLRDGNEIASSRMGISILNYSLNLNDSCDFGNYTCIATIDDMQESSTILVVPTAGGSSSSSDNEHSCEPAVITLTIFLVITVIGLIISVVINIIQRRNKRHDFTEDDKAQTDIKLSAASTESRSNLMAEPDYVACESGPRYKGASNVNDEPQYEGITTFTVNQEPEYEAVSNYKRPGAIPHSPIYANTLEARDLKASYYRQ